MSQPTITISNDEEIALICRLIYYNPTGYHSNAQKLYKAIKDERYNFLYKKIRDWLEHQQQYQIYKPPLKNITRVSYRQISHPNCVHMCDLLFLTHDYYKNKK